MLSIPVRTILLLTLLGVAFLKLGAIAEAAPIRTMSFNVHADFEFGTPVGTANAWVSTTGSHRRDLATAVIAQEAPDVLGVQEAFASQVVDLSNALPDYQYDGVGRNNGASFGEHSAIYYRDDRFTRTAAGTFWLSNTPDRPSIYPSAGTYRIASWVVLRDSTQFDREVFVLNSHWASGFGGTAAREHSAQLVRDRIDLLAGERPVIVMGDLNAFDFQPAMQILRGEHDPDGFELLDSYRQINPETGPNERTNHGYLGASDGRRIDYVLHTADLAAVDAAIVRTAYDGSFPSDHYPVTATLAYVPALAGDYSHDGTVDAADYTVWRDGLVADGYEVWSSQYGTEGTTAENGQAMVPEPSSAGIGLLAVAIGGLVSRSQGVGDQDGA